MKKYDINVLIEAVNDYLYAENELKLFLRTWKGGWWTNKTAQEREDYTRYDRTSSEKWNTVNMMCRLLDIDSDRLIAMVKSMNRYEKRERWQVCAHVNEDKATQFLTKDDGWGTRYYTSTGRKILA